MSDRSNKTALLEPHTRNAEAGPEKERSSEHQPESTVHRVPRLCLLDGFSEELNEGRGINLTRLEALTVLQVKTASAFYQITGPRTVQVEDLDPRRLALRRRRAGDIVRRQLGPQLSEDELHLDRLIDGAP